jgi:hypothetical protein
MGRLTDLLKRKKICKIGTGFSLFLYELKTRKKVSRSWFVFEFKGCIILVWGNTFSTIEFAVQNAAQK